ncbi:hypothetical protein SPI_07739 [Niveomyces insectorum RCEF 264]|uniref:Uncharacterized protein n=1 Tax=Niveomyces insectorum RCEF 264 TaxID=1081102 RepID=A0A167PJU1_9HYPO|nr:hypothetical protein SPI_07739 [Niveomyces insectorum RCEF 264]
MSEKDVTTSGALDVPGVHDDGPLGVPSDATETFYIDPAKERAALRKFEFWLVPVAFSFLVLSSLDRNNVSERERTDPVAPPFLTA